MQKNYQGSQENMNLLKRADIKVKIFQNKRNDRHTVKKLVDFSILEWQIFWFCLLQSQHSQAKEHEIISILRQRYSLNKNTSLLVIELRNWDLSLTVVHSEKSYPILVFDK